MIGKILSGLHEFVFWGFLALALMSGIDWVELTAFVILALMVALAAADVAHEYFTGKPSWFKDS